MHRKEYPRPQWKRDEYEILNGTWQFAFDDTDCGRKEKWQKKCHTLPMQIEVPFAFQSEKSGIHDTKFHDVIWYKREITVPKEWEDKRIRLHFGAVDYKAEVFVNGELVGTHAGGNTSFFFDITDHLTYETEEICVRCVDPSEDQFIPRGKQYWKENSESIWYTRTSGIWQSVWMEPVGEICLESVFMTPDIDLGNLALDGTVSGEADAVRVIIKDGNEVVLDDRYSLSSGKFRKTVSVFERDIMKTFIHHHGKLWSPEHPHLYTIIFELYKEDVRKDRVESYFGMRKIDVKDGRICLNNRPYEQRLVLDQGYFPEGLLTAPTAEDLRKDILIAKEMGFNGCRKHQKVEDPLFLYYADKEGFIVWGEMANSANFSEEYALAMTKEWCDVLTRDYNHPCIVCWVPLNESWGVPEIATDKKQQAHAMSLYYLTKSVDQTRLVISNDGWEMVKTDICGIHNYAHGSKEDLKQQKWFEHALSTKETLLEAQPAGRAIYVGGCRNEGEPIILTEFGGIAYTGNNDGWGYTVASDEEDFMEELQRIMNAIHSSSGLNGFVYTQLTDVEQEINGLVRYDRAYKFAPEKIRKIITGR